MKLAILNLLIILSLFADCMGQVQSIPKEIFSKEFNWRIEIPVGFNSVPPERWRKMETKGTEMIEKTYDFKVQNMTKTIFVFESDQFNYFESNYQPFDTSGDGDYLKSFREVNNILYGTFEAQIPQAQFDSASSQETIDGKLFQTFRVTIVVPDKLRMEYIMYSRLFGNKEFTVNILTMNEEKQKTLLNAWRNSKFDTRSGSK